MFSLSVACEVGNRERKRRRPVVDFMVLWKDDVGVFFCGDVRLICCADMVYCERLLFCDEALCR